MQAKRRRTPAPCSARSCEGLLWPRRSAAKPCLPRRLAEAPVRMMVPRPRGSSRRAASRPTRKPPKQPIRQNSSNCCAVSLTEIDALIVAGIEHDEVGRVAAIARRHRPVEQARRRRPRASCPSPRVRRCRPRRESSGRPVRSSPASVRRRGHDALARQIAGIARRQARARRQHPQRRRLACSWRDLSSSDDAGCAKGRVVHVRAPSVI